MGRDAEGRKKKKRGNLSTIYQLLIISEAMKSLRPLCVCALRLSELNAWLIAVRLVMNYHRMSSGVDGT